MITEKEIQAVELSPTKKDFYQIWNELLETASKISERWDPTSTNESDPGIVLLKVLSALGDKLNYNIDKNILEAFMPSATQQESMRKLCDMMGYNMKYFGSATTSATIKYVGETWPSSGEIVIPKYSTLTDRDNQISYITLDQIVFTNDGTSKFITDTVNCIEGQYCVCENNGNSNQLVTISQIDDNQRYYLPETQIAENGIFIYDGTVSESGLNLNDKQWTRVDNLNTQKLEYKCFKISFDSKKNIPYIQFPKDISSLIGDGLRIIYIRTNGVNGNISANTLSTLNEPELWKETPENGYNNISVDDFIVTNPSAATNGYDPESIDSAYNNYKKTIGTFDTLVTCRDYMNKIYQLTEDDINTTPLVSNIIVSDIRDDINRSFTLCEFSDYGIKYTDKVIAVDNENLIDHFDIVLYPFRSITSGISEDNYLKSFTYSEENSVKIEDDIENYKTISHSIKYPNKLRNDIVCIKNYLKLNAKITTVTKVNTTEEASILSAVYSAIYNAFNLRQLDFGEMIPFDDILDCIEGADNRIKNVALDEPILYTVFMTADNHEYSIESSTGNELDTAKELYNRLAIRNILAGKIALFNYNEDFKYEYTEKVYAGAQPVYPPSGTAKKLISLEPIFNLNNQNDPYTLNSNEVIQFRASSFKTKTTYPAYVNYYIHLENADGTDGIPAKFRSIGQFLLDEVSTNIDRWDILLNSLKFAVAAQASIVVSNFDSTLTECGALWRKSGTDENPTYTRVKSSSELLDPPETLYYIPFNGQTFPTIYDYTVSQTINTIQLSGIYKSLGWNATRIPGYLVDSSKVKYKAISSFSTETHPLTAFYVQDPYTINNTLVNGLGVDPVIGGLSKGENYELKSNEYLLINYTEASSSSDTADEKIIKNIEYTEGTIICPNFILQDSESVHTEGQRAYSKKSGFTFDNYSIEGMFSLGSSEQIEIKERTELVLGESKEEHGGTTTYKYSNVYIYWDLLDEDKLLSPDGKTIVFPWETTTVSGVTKTSYTLKSGEYFYFTDDSKLDMSYYGAGTEIVKKGNINIDKTKKQSTKKTADELLNAGINSIDWWKISPNQYNNIKFIEYQYISLIEEDKLVAVSNNSDTPTRIDLDLTRTYTPCKSAKYILSGSGSESWLPKIDVTGSSSWEVRSILQVDVGPTQTQTLHEKDSINIKYDDNSTGIICPIEDPSTHKLRPISIKSNYQCQSASESKYVDVRIGIEGNTSDEIKWINDFKIKTFNDEELEVINTGNNTANVTVATHNFGDYWTKVSMKDFTDTSSHLDLYITLPNDSTCYGLSMIYLIPSSDTATTQPYILKSSESDSYTPQIFNNNGWWNSSTYVDGNKYYLKSGINVIYIDKSTTLQIYPDTEYNANIIISDLDIINKSLNNQYGIANDILKYQKPSTSTSADIGVDLLERINTYDKDHLFYYNCRIENSDAIDINDSIDSYTNKPIETLASPSIWYDYNNVNNKFVVSEIDSAYMKKYGISIARSSKR